MEDGAPDHDETIVTPSGASSPFRTRPLSDGAGPAGTTVGRYRIVGRLGEGGMGLVFEAEQELPRRRVALKMILGGHLADDLAVRMFEREAEMLGRLEHPGIAAIYEAGRAEGGQYYLAMELVRGRTVDIYLRERGRVTATAELQHRLRMFLDICDAVHYAHQRGVIHRDLKPANIIVGESEDGAPRIKVLDFGVARLADPVEAEAAELSRTGLVRGTLAYMSPEQVSGNPGAIDIRTDVYSLGIVLYQMIAGELPYAIDSKALLDAARSISEAPPKPLGAPLAKLAGPDLQTILAKALEKDPGARYASAAALRDDVDRYLNDQPILARAPSSGYQLRKLITRNKLPFLAGAAAVVFVIGFGVLMSLLYRRSEANLARAIAAERKAATEAATARQVAGFVTDLFEVSDPNESRGNQVTARELLDAGAQRVRTELAGAPEVRSRMMRTIGVVYSRLGLYKQAHSLLSDSIDAAAPSELAENRAHLGVVEGKLGRNEEARKNLEAALAAQERDLPPDAAPILRNRIALANVLMNLGKYPESRALFEQTLPALERTEGAQSKDLANARNLYGDLLADLGDNKAALSEYEGALAAMEKVLPPDHPLIADLLQNVATMHAVAGDLEKSKDIRLRAIAIQEKTLGPDHPKTLEDRENMAILYSNLGDPERALPIFEDNLERWERTLGPTHPNVGQTLSNLGYTLYLMKRFEQARTALERALKIREAAGGDTHVGVNLTRYNLANVYTELGRYPEARALFLRVIDADRKHFGENSQDVADDLESYADLLKRSGQTREQHDVEARRAAIVEKLKAAK